MSNSGRGCHSSGGSAHAAAGTTNSMSNSSSKRPSSGESAATAKETNNGGAANPSIQFNNNVYNVNSHDRSQVTINYSNSSVNNTAANSERASTGDNLSSRNDATLDTTSVRTVEPNTTGNTVEQVTVNEEGLPVLPPSLIPYKKGDINEAHCSKPANFAYYWAVDKTQRLNGKNYNMFPMNPHHVARFGTLLNDLYSEIARKGKEIMKQKFVDGFRGEGFILNGQLPNDFRSVMKIIGSRSMRKAFEQDPLFPFCYTTKHIYTQLQDSNSAPWFDETIRKWLSTRDAGELRYDFIPRIDSGVRTTKHVICKIALSMTNDLIKEVRKIEEDTFGCSVRTKKVPSRNTKTGQKNEEKAKKAMNTGEPHDHDFYMIPICEELHKIGFNNRAINCYLKVLKKAFPYLGSNGTPSLEDFRKANRVKPYTYGNMFVQSAITNNIRKEEAVKHVEEVYEAALNDRFIGRGAHNHCVDVEMPVLLAVTQSTEHDVFCTVDRIETQQQTGLMQPFQTTAQNYGVTPAFDFLNFSTNAGGERNNKVVDRTNEVGDRSNEVGDRTNEVDASLLLNIGGPSMNKYALYSNNQQTPPEGMDSLHQGAFSGTSMNKCTPYSNQQAQMSALKSLQPSSYCHSPEKIELGSMTSLFDDAIEFDSPHKKDGGGESMKRLSLDIIDRSSMMGTTNISSVIEKDMDNMAAKSTEWPLNGAKKIGEILHLSPVELAKRGAERIANESPSSCTALQLAPSIEASRTVAFASSALTSSIDACADVNALLALRERE